MKIIGVAGIRRSGKDTVCDWLVSRLHAVRLSFAAALKKAVRDIFQVDSMFIDMWKGRHYPPPGWNLLVREVLQSIGEFCREVRPSVWIDLTLAQAQRHPGRWLVISDVRYPDEVVRIRQLGGMVWLVKRPQANDGDPLLRHSSEFYMWQELFSPETAFSEVEKFFQKHYKSAVPAEYAFDEVIDNSSTVKDLHAKLESLAKKFGF